MIGRLIRAVFARRTPVFEVRRNGEKPPYVVEIAGNGEVLNTSEGYASVPNANRAARRRAMAVDGGRWRPIGGQAQDPRQAS